VYAVQQDAGAPFYVFETPITYQNHTIGQLRIGLTTDALATANRTTLLTLLTWFAIVLLVVVAGTYWLTRRLQMPLDAVSNALDQIKMGRLEHRIRMHRRDDFERLFAAYNAMADVLEARQLQRDASQIEQDLPLGVDKHLATVKDPVE
jgi:serine/threonine-protein kinase